MVLIKDRTTNMWNKRKGREEVVSLQKRGERSLRVSLPNKSGCCL